MSEDFKIDKSRPPLCRRTQDRFRVDASCTIYINKNLGQTSIARDISLRGLGAISDCPFNIGKRVTISIQTPYIHNFIQKKKATVVWCTKLQHNLWQTGLELDWGDAIQFA